MGGITWSPTSKAWSAISNSRVSVPSLPFSMVSVRSVSSNAEPSGSEAGRFTCVPGS